MSVLYISDAVLVDILEVIDRIGPLRTRAACRDGDLRHRACNRKRLTTSAETLALTLGFWYSGLVLETRQDKTRHTSVTLKYVASGVTGCDQARLP